MEGLTNEEENLIFDKTISQLSVGVINIKINGNFEP
jgi:hypothetical protein